MNPAQLIVGMNRRRIHKMMKQPAALLVLIALFNAAGIPSTVLGTLEQSRGPAQPTGKRFTTEEMKQIHSFDRTESQVLIIGDSISRGYHKQVMKALNGKAKVSRSSTGLIPSGSDKLDSLLGDTQWDVITFNWGLHELKNGEPKDLENRTRDYLERLKAVVLRLKKTNAKLIFVTTTPVPEPNKHKRLNTYVLAYNEGAKALMRDYGITVCDIFAVIEPVHEGHEAPSLKPGLRDVHFTDSGYALMGNAVAKTIASKLNAD